MADDLEQEERENNEVFFVKYSHAVVFFSATVTGLIGGGAAGYLLGIEFGITVFISLFGTTCGVIYAVITSVSSKDVMSSALKDSGVSKAVSTSIIDELRNILFTDNVDSSEDDDDKKKINNKPIDNKEKSPVKS